MEGRNLQAPEITKVREHPGLGKNQMGLRVLITQRSGANPCDLNPRTLCSTHEPVAELVPDGPPTFALLREGWAVRCESYGWQATRHRAVCFFSPPPKTINTLLTHNEVPLIFNVADLARPSR